MKILVIHNTYQQTGGEDAVVGAEERLLTEGGHTIIRYRRGNDELRKARALRLAQAGIETIWSAESSRQLDNLIDRERPDVAHFHNTFPLISPAAYYVCHDAGIPVIQTLHNYRLLCPASTFFRDGRVCESCLGRSVPWPGVVHACYHDSRATTSAISGMITLHHVLRTWNTKVDIYVALSEFARKQFIEGGLPQDRIVVKHNFVAGNPSPKAGDGEYALYVGRLTEEKGIRSLLAAWNTLAAEVPLKMAGDGPMREEVISEIGRLGIREVEVLGRVSPNEISRLMRGARFLVFPSTCFENFPLAIAEAYACGLPVIVSRLGAMPGIVLDGKTGLHFTPGDAEDLAAKVGWAWAHPEEIREMGHSARTEYEAKYTAERNYHKLMEIYSRAIAERKESLPLKSNREQFSRRISGVIRDSMRRLGRPIHKKLRGEKRDLFFQFIGDSPTSTLLDVGGGMGMDSEFVPLYHAFENVTVVNLTPPQSNLCSLKNVRHEIADGCRLPYPSKSFDWVFSNAVIEHVGSEERQRQFASEIRRVSKYGYFVTTPNKRFPIDPHSLLPFYQYMPESWQRRLARFSPYYLEHYEEIRLLCAEQMGKLFPEAKIRSVGFPMIGTSLLAMYRDPNIPDEDSKVQKDQMKAPNRFRVLGVDVDAVQIPRVVHEVENWMQSHDRCRTIAVTGMHGVMEAQHETSFKAILNSSDMVVPDGMPLVWIARLRGYQLGRRVYGPELMSTVFARIAGKGYRHFLYGGGPGLAERLAERLQQRFPGTKIAGCYSPPFRSLTPDEDANVVKTIENAHPDIVWVGLSTPKQEKWMDAHRDKLHVPVLVGVGAAFDILAGTKRQAPAWIREHGLEWLFRLLQEPERLWRRYVVYGSEFVFLATLELLGLRKWD